jgi:hypothetical protein
MEIRESETEIIDVKRNKVNWLKGLTMPQQLQVFS